MGITYLAFYLCSKFQLKRNSPNCTRHDSFNWLIAPFWCFAVEKAAGFPRFHTVKHKIFPIGLKANQKENYNENKYLRTHLRILWGKKLAWRKGISINTNWFSRKNCYYFPSPFFWHCCFHCGVSVCHMGRDRLWFCLMQGLLGTENKMGY